MYVIKINNKAIIRPDGKEISDDSVEKIISGNTETVKSEGFIRLEHPSCAFFMTSLLTDEKEIKRKTLYTPEGRLHIDFEKTQSNEVQIDKYVKKQEHLDTLLLYLRDVHVKPSLHKADSDTKILLMPNTPLYEFYLLVQDDVFKEAISEYENTAKHILYQLKRIFNAKIDILAQSLTEETDYAVFEDIDIPEIDDEFMERWHDYYIRKARLLKH